MHPNTSSGLVIEKMLIPVLESAGYSYRKRYLAGDRPNGGKHYCDLVVEDEGKQILISVKWQQVSGTAEQKIPYELICLKYLLENHSSRYSRAYLVLGGSGWTLKEFYLSGKLRDFLNYDGVQIVDLDGFIARVNKRSL